MSEYFIKELKLFNFKTGKSVKHKYRKNNFGRDWCQNVREGDWDRDKEEKKKV